MIDKNKLNKIESSISDEYETFGDIPETLPILPLKDLVAYPRLKLPFKVAAHSAAVIDSTLLGNRILGLVTLRPSTGDEPTPEDHYGVGTAAKIINAKRDAEGAYTLLLSGFVRFRVLYWVTDGPYPVANVVKLPDVVDVDTETEALQREVKRVIKDILTGTTQVSEEVADSLTDINDPLHLAHIAAFNMNLSIEVRQSLLEADSVNQKLRDLLTHLSQELEVLEIGKRIQSEVRENMSHSQRNYLLRQHLNALKKELGETEGDTAAVDEIAERIEKARMSGEAREAAMRELERLEQMSPQSIEYPGVRTYLEWLCDLPWARASVDNVDIFGARKVLDDDHFGLNDVKERLVEFLAVRRLAADRKPSPTDIDGVPAMGIVLCLVGPPGVGKTSLGRSIANALGRTFTRMSLGGVRDEAEIRGHRRTYVGAVPGRIIHAIKQAGTRNPVFMLDEIDKVGNDWRGDPASALLEVLDPAQNQRFRDHYLNVDFDLSDVIFIATANQIETIPGPLRDRMETIRIDGYTELEKQQIAKRHLIPRQLLAHRLGEDEVTFMDDAVFKIIRDYTREAGVRSLERRIAAICRKSIVQLSETGWSHIVITSKTVRELLRKERFEPELPEPITIPGVVTGLAVTPVGGSTLFVEATRMVGKGRLTVTGQLGAVMTESAQLAYSYVRSKATVLSIDAAEFDQTDVHLHVPAGALPKDGPSAGVAMVVALVSLFTGKPARTGLGVTGEITLRGRVLPVGGIKMKLLAAHRAGLESVILPERNRRDLEDVPTEVMADLTILTADHIDDVISEAFPSPVADRADVTQGPWETDPIHCVSHMRPLDSGPEKTPVWECGNGIR
jgi:ATP-dependent Lon protease